jgi:hypothetical protein
MVSAQNSDYEIKVVSYHYKTTRGQLKKVSAEGIGVEDYKGNYIIYRPADIVRIKIKKRGLTFGEAVGGGALAGVGISGAILSLDQDGDVSNDMLKATAVLIALGASSGVIVGLIAEIISARLILKVNGSPEFFKANYKRLEKYINTAELTQHVNE